MAQNVVTSGGNPARLGVPAFIQFGQPRRRSAFQAAFGVFFAPMATDAVGSCTLTLSNVVVGSRVVVRDQNKTTVMYNDVATASTVVITLDVYSPGSPLNDLLVDVRQGHTAPYYQRYKTFLTAAVGSVAHYVNQLPDQR